MDKKQEETRICITQQKTFILLSLEIDFQLEAMFNREEDKIMFLVLKALEEVTH
jgi:hypothetical protein